MSIRHTALVTGASRGIGRAIAGRLAAEGYDLYLTCRKQIGPLEQLAANLEQEYGICCAARQCDVGDSAQVTGLFLELESAPCFDLLVNNAGISYVGLLQEMGDEDWDRVIRTNLSSVFYCTKKAIPLFLRNRSVIPDVPGRILNISSVWGNVGASCEAAYSASKGGVNALTKALAKELAPSGIPVNAIAFGVIDTDMNRCFSDEERAALANEIPAGRFASPEEAADEAMRILSSPAYLTGQVISFDGGWI